MNEHLKAAATTGNVDMLYTQIQADPYVLERIDAIPFVDTPLHVAASARKVKFATEIIRLKPSFASKLNGCGFSPMHLALESQNFEMVRRLLNINKDLVRVKGKGGFTPLHLVCRDGEVDLLVEFLSASPESIQDVTVQSETAMHIAVNNRQFKALKILVRWLQCDCSKGARNRQQSMLNWKDEDGNTILHILVGQNDPNPQMVKLLIQCKINMNSKNLGAMTALDIVEHQNQNDHNVVKLKKMLLGAGALHSDSVRSSPTLAEELLGLNITFLHSMKIRLDRAKDNITNETRNILLAVAVLVATSANQAALSPPGGVYQSNAKNEDQIGVSIMENTFSVFLAFNVVSLVASTVAIYILMPAHAGVTLLMTFPLFYFVFAFIFSMCVISPSTPTVPILFIIAACTVTLLKLISVCFGHNKSREINKSRNMGNNRRWHAWLKLIR